MRVLSSIATSRSIAERCRAYGKCYKMKRLDTLIASKSEAITSDSTGSSLRSHSRPHEEAFHPIFESLATGSIGALQN